MAEGSGKYDDICVEVLERTRASCACVIVIDGKKGNGFSVNSVSRDLIDVLPSILEAVANEIRTDVFKKAN
jgi:hypothetical protein